MKNNFKFNYFTKILIIRSIQEISVFLWWKKEINSKKIWSKYFWNLTFKDKIIYDFFNMIIKNLKIIHMINYWFWINESYTYYTNKIQENQIKKVYLNFSLKHDLDVYMYLPICIKRLLLNSYIFISSTNILQTLLNIYSKKNLIYKIKKWYISNYWIQKQSINSIKMMWWWTIRYYYFIFNTIAEYLNSQKKEKINILFSEISYFFIELVNEFFYIFDIYNQVYLWWKMYWSNNVEVLQSIWNNNLLKIIHHLYDNWKIKKNQYEYFINKLNNIS